MNRRSDDRQLVDRSRLCELANVERGRHIRWSEAAVLHAKERYTELDVLRAAAYDELRKHLKPKLARAVWRQVGDVIDHPGGRLEVVVCTATMSAHIARSARELDRLLPRNEAAIVVDLHPRMTRVRERFAEYRRTAAVAGGEDTAQAPTSAPHGQTVPMRSRRGVV
jgi:hypothetical protein